MTSRTILRYALALSVVASLASCGGGGGGGTAGGSGTATGFAALPPAASVAAMCAAPRSGVDPYTKQAYPDKQGTLLNEQNWLAAWTNDLYLWYSEVPYPEPASYADTGSYFQALKTTAKTASGVAKDHFHYNIPTPDWQAQVTGAPEAGYGVNWSVLSSSPPRSFVVAYTDPNSPATQLAPALARGAKVLQVDGVDLVNDNTTAGIAKLNAGLSPATAGERHTFVVQDLGGGANRTITMTSANVTPVAVQNVGTLAGTTVGYMLFTDHMMHAESALIAGVAQLKAANVTDLVIDIRYNGGGLLDIASELGYMVAGPTQTKNKTFELLTFNDKHKTIDPVNGGAITPTPFFTTALGFSTASGTVLPYLGLTRVYVLTGPGTCSASESLMNGLRGAGVEVIQIGSKTCGKPYGFYDQDNCGTTYLSIEFKGVNALGFGDYSDGFAPANNAAAATLDPSAVFPGCTIADDFTHALGDPAEARLAAALQYRANGTCPSATGLGQARQLKSLAATDGYMNKSLFLTNRILRR